MDSSIRIDKNRMRLNTQFANDTFDFGIKMLSRGVGPKSQSGMNMLSRGVAKSRDYWR